MVTFNYWYKMEHHGKSTLPKEFKKVRIMSGPLFLPQTRTVKDFRGNDKLEFYKEYKLIGKKHVSVPTHLFKIYLCEPEDETEKKLLAAFVVPNEDIQMTKPLTDFQVPPSFIEHHSGLHIYPLLKLREGVDDLCSTRNELCQLLTGEDWIIHDLHRKLSWNHDNEENLTKIYNKLKEMNALTASAEETYRKQIQNMELMKRYEKVVEKTNEKAEDPSSRISPKAVGPKGAKTESPSINPVDTTTSTQRSTASSEKVTEL